ncbi:MAG: NUDIX domain-containing protein [Gammaproteobacteria bacterium]|nr:NUDIX domain-containing protein [Gammaproteobacteria bacterium]
MNNPNLHTAVEVLDKSLGYGGFFRLERYRLRHTLFAGGWSGELVRESLERGNAAAVLPYDPVLDSVVMIEQFRIGAIGFEKGAWLIEIVAGIVEPGESAEEVALRESEEEAACILTDLEFLYDYHVSPGGSSECIALFCGRVDASKAGGIHGLAAEGEDIRVHVFTVDKALEMLQAGEIHSATPIIALQWLALNRQKLQTRWN